MVNSESPVPAPRAPLPAPPDVSIVTTLYRSERFLDEFHRRATAAVRQLADSYEIVLVNDGSPDHSLERAIDLHRRDPRVKVVDLSRNFGHHKAMMTGLAHARGRRVFLIDCDLEEAPELLGEFHRRLEADRVDVVYGIQARRKGGAFERWSGNLFFGLVNRLSSHPLPANLSTVRLMSRRYVDNLVAHRESEMVIAGLWVITGFEQVGVPIDKGSRPTTSYGLAKRIGHLVNAVTSFSDRPLVLVFYLGLGIMFLSGSAALYLIVKRLFFGVLLAGWPSLIVSVWLLGGMTLFSIGIVGIYVAKVFMETKRRPYTIVRAVHESSGDGEETRV
jgi:putative glycosyltransferase